MVIDSISIFLYNVRTPVRELTQQTNQPLPGHTKGPHMNKLSASAFVAGGKVVLSGPTAAVLASEHPAIRDYLGT